MTWKILEWDVQKTPWPVDSESVQCVVTSPPYWGLRDYGIEGQLGLERTPQEYTEKMVHVFREVRRVLRDDGTLWLNLGDCYASGGRGLSPADGTRWKESELQAGNRGNGDSSRPNRCNVPGLKPKDLVGIPWRVAFALQADGWWLRSDIVWSKPNPMPESVRDRPTRAHEYLFLLSKSERYYYDQAAIATEPKWPDGPNAPDKIKSPYGQGYSRRAKIPAGWDTGPGDHWKRDGRYRSGNKRRDVPSAEDGRGIPNDHLGRSIPWEASTQGVNARSVWEIPTEPYPEAHFATFPTELPRRCILAGSRPGDLVLDPFSGAGTTTLVADRLNRHSIGLELNPTYVSLARHRIASDAPLLQQIPPEDAPPSLHHGTLFD